MPHSFVYQADKVLLLHRVGVMLAFVVWSVVVFWLVAVFLFVLWLTIVFVLVLGVYVFWLGTVLEAPSPGR